MNKLEFVEMYEVLDVLPLSALVETGESFAYRLEKIGFYGDKHFLFYHHDGMGRAYYEKKEVQLSQQKAFDLFTDVHEFERYKKDILGVINDLKEYSEFAGKFNYERASLDELFELESKRREEEAKIFAYYNSTQPQNANKLELELRRLLGESRVQDSEIDEVMGVLTTASELSKTGEEELDWLEIVTKVNAGEDSGKLLSEHFKKYFALMLGDGNWNPQVSELEKRLSSDLQSFGPELLSRVTTLSNYGKVIAEKKTNLVSKYALDDEIMSLVDLIIQIGHLRFSMRVDGWLPFFYRIDPLQEIAKRLSIPIKDLQYCTLDEFNSLSTENPVVSKESLGRRAADGVFLMEVNDGVIKFLFGSDAKERAAELLDKSDKMVELEELTGMIAMPGEVVGSALIFNWGESLEEAMNIVKTDSILVAGQTRPQIMPLIRMCKGIVTDEGGVISHAAIVARELKLPCIVGTKIATKVFKTGDRIVLDANNGRVYRDVSR